MLYKAIRTVRLSLCNFLVGCKQPEAIRPPPIAQVTAKKPADAIFGRVDENGRWQRLRDVKFAPGKTFGWRIRLPCVQPVEYTEIMKLPSKGDFKYDPQELRETTNSADGKTATTHAFVAFIDG